MTNDELSKADHESAPVVGEGESLPPVAAKARRSVYHVAAIFSLWLPLVGGGLMPVVEPMGLQKWIFVVIVAALGVLAGLFALLGIRRYGTQRLLMRALAGIFIGWSLIMNALTVPMMQRARAAKAEARRAEG